jgi:hypothetical protein
MKIAVYSALVLVSFVPTIALGQVTKTQCLEYCDGEKYKTDVNCKLLPNKREGKKCLVEAASDLKTCTKSCQCIPTTGDRC